MTTRLIDIHPHIISPDTKAYPLDPLGGERSGWSATRPATFEELIAEMDAAGVDKAAIVHSSTTYGFDNAYVADSIAADPGRFAGVYSIDMLAPDASQKMRYWQERGMSGLRIFTTGSTMPDQAPTLSDPSLYKAWSLAGDLDIPVCVQMTKAAIPELEHLLKTYPKTVVIVDHLMKAPIVEGAPYTGSQYLFDLARFDNLNLKLTSRNTSDAQIGKGTPETFFPLLVQKFGADRIAWGSNFPASEENLLKIVSDLKLCLASLSEQDRHWIMAGTAQRLYPQLAD